MVLPKDPFFTDLGVAGILGGDAFSQSVVTFDSRYRSWSSTIPIAPRN